MPSFIYLYKKQMKALTFHGKLDIRYEKVPDPKIKEPTDAIVKVSQTAVCGSDLHIYHERESGLDTGTVMGHEFIGEVVEKGKDVRILKKGEMVASPFTTNCGKCYFCDIGLTARCINGQLYGWVDADDTLVSIPEDLPPNHVLLSGDILSTGYFCADMAEINQGGLYIVIGCGPVGIMTIMSAFEQGALHIIAIDSVPARLEMANRLGAIAVPLHENPVLNVMEKTHGTGAEAVMEAVGSPVAQDLAIKLVRPGGIISSVGVHTSDLFTFTPADAYKMNLTYRTGRCSARYYMDILLPKLEDWPFDLDMIISHELPLSKGPRAYEMFDRKEENSMKILLNPGLSE